MINWVDGRDIWYHDAVAASAECPPEEMNAEDPMFILSHQIDRQTKRCLAYHRRLHGLCINDTSVCVRLP